MRKVTERLHALEEVSNNVKLLHEMLLHYSHEDSSDGDRELMKVGPDTAPLTLCAPRPTVLTALGRPSEASPGPMLWHKPARRPLRLCRCLGRQGVLEAGMGPVPWSQRWH